jgi:DNA-binding CsgD family transcriptional regulator/PAS domain-containing protein
MTTASNAFRDLPALAYDAALDGALWPEVARHASRAFDAAHVRIGLIDRRGQHVMDAASHPHNNRPLDPRFLLPDKNPVIAFATASAPMSVVTRVEIVSDRDLERSEIYNEFMRPLDLWHALLTNLHRDETLIGPMSVVRRRSQPRFEERERHKLRRFASHASRALRVHLRLRELEAHATAMGDRALTALALTDAHGRVAEANPLAQAILAEGDGLVLRDGVLRATGGGDCARLTLLIAEAAGGARTRASGASGVLQVSRPSGRRPLALAVTPTRNAASPFGRSHAVTIAFADPERPPEADADFIARLYGFTGREASVAALLIEGRTPHEAAAELAMTDNTIRTHIHHLLCKTGAERLSDLIRLLMQGPGVRGR